MLPRRRPYLVDTIASSGPLPKSLPQIVWLASADCCVGYQNRRWCEYTGLSSADSMGFGWKRAFHADDLPETLRRWERAVRVGEPCELAFRLRRSDGVYRWFQGRAEPLLDDDNRPVGVVRGHAARATTRCEPSKPAASSHTRTTIGPEATRKSTGDRAKLHLRFC